MQKILTGAKKGKASPIVVKDANTVIKGQERNLHHKFITINGYYVDPAYKDSDNRRSKIVFTGSPNLTSTGLRHNNEILLRLRSTTDHTAYTKNFTTIWDKYSKAFRYVNPN
jgi:phosphatidylserine/phosphatidylglycerophosphate/cardiolipin synthase-like enzyme